MMIMARFRPGNGADGTSWPDVNDGKPQPHPEPADNPHDRVRQAELADAVRAQNRRGSEPANDIAAHRRAHGVPS
jgi:hypothetical protein